MEENKEAAQIFLCVIIISINTQTERFLRAHHTHAAQVYKILIFPAVLKFFATLEFQILQISQKFKQSSLTQSFFRGYFNKKKV